MSRWPARRRLLAPEVVQTSEMDCGPAALKCILGGFGIRVSYGRLREACQTDVDGTSIDTVEELASTLGLDAEQIMLPLDHLLDPASDALPAIVVVRLPSGLNHFVVVWRRHGSWVQVMDPAVGRRWTRLDRFQQEVYRHRQAVPAESLEEWMRSTSFIAPLGSRLAALGVSRRVRRRLVARARDECGGLWGLATLDAATRMTASLVRSGGVDAGGPARRMLEAIVGQAAREPGRVRQLIPEPYWIVRPLDGDEEREPGAVELTGAVLVRARRRAPAAAAPAAPDEPEAALVSTLTRRRRSVAGTLSSWLAKDGLIPPPALLAATAFAAGVVLVQALLLRVLIDLGVSIRTPEQTVFAFVALAAFLAGLMLLELPIAAAVLRMGRHLETRARAAFREKIPRLGDRYFRSRPISDMAERSHGLHALRSLPDLAAQILRTTLTMVFTAAAIVWLDPSLALAALAGCVIPPLLVLALQPVLLERELRVRTHVGALGRFYLDSLLGLVPVRNHGAERTIRREHEDLLTRWAQASLDFRRSTLWLGGLQTAAGVALSAWLLFARLAHGPAESPALLLLTFWALSLPGLGRQLGELATRIPQLRATCERLLEPITAPEDEPIDDAGEASVGAPDAASAMAAADASHGVGLRLRGVGVRAAGHAILEDVDLDVRPGEHVAVVGRSGAGKSSLVGLLLGWHRASAGSVEVDEASLDAARLDALRRETAWVDPAVQIWNRSVLENLRYGAPGGGPPLGETLDSADLVRLLERLPDGLQTTLGEGGGLVSGGEGQRLRLGRALQRRSARLVILDEPFRALDRAQRGELTRRARRLWAGATLLFISHDISETRDFDRVVVMEGGRIVEVGRPGDLLGDPRSRLAALLAAEERVRGLWKEGFPRRLRMVDGRLEEGGAC